MLRSTFVLALVLIVAPVNGYDLVISKSASYHFPRAHLLTPSADDVIGQLAKGFTLSLNFHPNSDHIGQTQTLISYSSYDAGNYDELNIAFGPNGKKLVVTMGEVKTTFQNAELKNDDWTNIIVTYKAIGGVLTAYIGGEEIGKKQNFQVGYNLQLKGVFVLGQDQYSYYGTYFEANKGCVGKISDVHIFNKALDPNDVKQVHKCKLTGTALSWWDSQWGLYDSGMVKPSTTSCSREKCGARKDRSDA